jgi:hypothetical protein
MVSATDRNASLAEFAAARDQFVEAVKAVPDEALGYLKPGDDYALGGLVIHVNAWLVHYNRALDEVIAAGFEHVDFADPAGYWQEANARAKEGLTPPERGNALAAMTAAHTELADKITSLSAEDFERKGPVVYKAGDEPYPTSSADILGWMKDHYMEHVPHAKELLESWRGSPSR